MSQDDRFAALSAGLRGLRDGQDGMAEGVKNLEKALRQQQDLLQEIPQALTHQSGTLLQGLQDAVEQIVHSSADMEIIKHMASLNAGRQQLEVEQNEIDREVEQRLEKQAVERKKYDEAQRDVDQGYMAHLRDLGKHAYELLEVLYQNNIEDRVNQLRHDEVCGKFDSHNSDVSARRFSLLNEKIRAVASEVDDLLRKRRNFDEEVEARAVPKQAKREKVLIPFWFVEYEDENGNAHRELVGPSELSKNHSGLSDMLHRDQRFAELREHLAEQKTRVLRETETESLSFESRDAAADEVEQLHSTTDENSKVGKAIAAVMRQLGLQREKG